MILSTHRPITQSGKTPNARLIVRLISPMKTGRFYVSFCVSVFPASVFPPPCNTVLFKSQDHNLFYITVNSTFPKLTWNIYFLTYAHVHTGNSNIYVSHHLSKKDKRHFQNKYSVPLFVITQYFCLIFENNLNLSKFMIETKLLPAVII